MYCTHFLKERERCDVSCSSRMKNKSNKLFAAKAVAFMMLFLSVH